MTPRTIAPPTRRDATDGNIAVPLTGLTESKVALVLGRYTSARIPVSLRSATTGKLLKPRRRSLAGDALRFAILELLTRDPGLDSEEIAGSLCVSDKLASDMCAELQRRGLVIPK